MEQRSSQQKCYYPPESKKSLYRLYRTKSGRIVLSCLVRPGVSKAAVRLLDSKLSRRYIPRFVRKNHINVAEAEERRYRSLNDFFIRRLKEGSREIEMEPNCLISPCDSRLSVFPIEESSVFSIKDSQYTVSSLLQGDKIEEKYRGGVCAVFRLTVSDYHRYCYFDNGTKEKNFFIPGKLHL